MGSELRILEKSGSWFSYNGERLGQGRENVKKYLRDNPDISLKLEQAILEHHGIARITPEANA